MSTNQQIITYYQKARNIIVIHYKVPNMNKYNRRKFSQLSTNQQSRSKTLPESERKSQQSSIGNFLSSMVFNLKPREKRSLQINENQKEQRSKRFSVVTDRSLIRNMNQQPQNDLQDGLIDISLPKPINLRVIKQSTGMMHRKKPKMPQKIMVERSTTKRDQRWQKMNKSRPIQRNISNTSSKTENEKIISPSQRDHLVKMQQLSCYLDEDKLYRRLCVYSKEIIKISIRLYREDLQKLIVHRYGKDRITTFLDTQYIEDCNSMLTTLKNLLKFTAEEMLVFVFLIMDQNCDGLITPEDLVNFTGAKNDKIFTNPLIMQDLHDMMSYLKKKYLANEDLMDLPSQQYDVLSDQFLTLMKFRVFKFQTMKKSNDKEGRKRRNKLMIGNVHQRLFTLRQDKKDAKTFQNRPINKGLSCMISFILKGNKKRLKRSEQITALQFAINIESFKQIFENKIPKTFLDFLYLFGGVESPKQSYLPIDSSVLIKQTQSKIQIVKQRGISKVKHLIEGMKEFSRESTVIYNTIISN